MTFLAKKAKIVIQVRVEFITRITDTLPQIVPSYASQNMTSKFNLPQTRQTILFKLLLCIIIPKLVSLQLGPRLLLQSTTMLCQ